MLELVLESAVASLLVAWNLMSVGISVSNASGNVIRSSVLSPYPPFALVIFTWMLTYRIHRRFLCTSRKLRKTVLLSIPAVMVVSSLPLLYYNIYYHYTAMFSGTAYNVFPYGIQSALPFMLLGFAEAILVMYGIPMFNKPVFTRRNRIG